VEELGGLEDDDAKFCASVELLRREPGESEEDSGDGKNITGGLAGFGRLVIISDETGIFAIKGPSSPVLFVSVYVMQ